MAKKQEQDKWKGMVDEFREWVATREGNMIVYWKGEGFFLAVPKS